MILTDIENLNFEHSSYKNFSYAKIRFKEAYCQVQIKEGENLKLKLY